MVCGFNESSSPASYSERQPGNKLIFQKCHFNGSHYSKIRGLQLRATGLLRALLDWSYGLLPEAEQLALRRLSVLVGAFTLEAACAIAHGGPSDQAAMLSTLDTLVAKSLLSALVGNDGSERYRLLETTRLYAREKLQESGDSALAARRHAEYFAMTAIARGMQLAHPQDEPTQRLRMLATRHLFLTRVADFRGALAAAKEWHSAAKQARNVTCLAIADLMQGVARHFRGNQAAARRHFDAGFGQAGERNLQLCGNDHRVRGLIAQSRTLWLSGLPERAMETARRTVSTALKSGKPLDTCFALIYTTPVYLWCGDWDAAQDVLEQLVNHIHWPVLKPFHSSAAAMQGALLIGRKDTELGAPMVQAALQKMRDERQNVVGTFVACWLAEGSTRSRRGLSSDRLLGRDNCLQPPAPRLRDASTHESRPR